LHDLGQMVVADAVAAIVVHFDLLPLRHVIAALAVALGAFDAEHVELALDVGEDEIGSGTHLTKQFRCISATARAYSADGTIGANGEIEEKLTAVIGFVRHFGCVLEQPLRRQLTSLPTTPHGPALLKLRLQLIDAIIGVGTTAF
jgi:hypothetical protein